MNGRKTLRCRAAVVGLALLMGSSFLGCHAGPRFFAKKDRDERTAKKEFADKGKFINKKKVRPEADYLKDDALADERVAKNDNKSKSNSKSKSTGSDRFRNSDELDRSIASRKRTDESDNVIAPATKSAASKQLASKDAAQPANARRPASKEIEDSLFDEPLPEKKTIVRPAVKPSAVAKNKAIDEDPFKNQVVNPFESKRAAEKVATVNFDDLEDDETDENDEDDELEIPARGAKNTVAAAKKTADQRATAASDDLKRKFLPDEDVDEMKSSATAVRRKAKQVEGSVARSSQQAGRTATKVRNDIDNSVTSNRQQAQQTLNDWRRELDQTDSGDTDSVVDVETPSLKTAASTSDRSARTQNSGHISQTTLDEFAPNKKSQGAILNGDLIIDTSNVPTRFQRTDSSGQSNNNTGRSNASEPSNRTRTNSGASIDIVPGSTQNRDRSAGQIRLQSLSAHDEENSYVEQAVYEQSSSAEPSEGLLPLLAISGNDTGEVSDAQSDSMANGPRLMPFDGDTEIQQSVASNTVSNTAAWNAGERTKSAFGWGTLTLVTGGIAAAVLIGIGLRRRKEALVPVPVRVPTPDPMRVDSPYDPTTWPRG